MQFRTALALGALCLVLLPAENPLAAQGPEQGDAPMRSALTIELRLDAIPQVNRERMTAFGQRVSASMTSLRECATRVMQRTPEAQGDIVITAFSQRGALRTTVENDETGNVRLMRCVQDLLTHVSLANLERPTGARMTFSFHNTLGDARAAARTAEAREAEVPLLRDGANYVAQGSFGQVEISVAAPSAEQARAFFSRTRAALPNFYDCRRRAGRRDHDPRATFQMRVTARANSLSVMMESAEIWDPMGATCASRAMTRRANTTGAPPSGQAQITVRYLPNPPSGNQPES